MMSLYTIIYRVLTIPGGAGFLNNSNKVLFFVCKYGWYLFIEARFEVY